MPGIFNRSIFNDEIFNTAEEVAAFPVGGSGYPAPHGSWKRKRLGQHVSEWIDELYAELTEPEVPKAVTAKAVAIVKPYVGAGAKAVPQPQVIDWKALERDAEKVSALLALWTDEMERQAILDDDDEIVMLDS